MEGVSGRSLVIFLFFIILMLNISSSLVIAPEGELDIVVDSTSKEVSPGEDAVFYWTAYNNDTYTSYELSVSSENRSEFSETYFILEPGEFYIVTQTIETSLNDTNNTFYLRHVRWDGVWHQGTMSGSILPMEGTITVTVNNNTNLSENEEDDSGNGENGEDDDKGDDSTPGFEAIILIGAILVAVIIMKRKRRM